MGKENGFTRALKGAWAAVRQFFVRNYYHAWFTYYSGRLTKYYRKSKNDALMREYFKEVLPTIKSPRKAAHYEKLLQKHAEGARNAQIDHYRSKVKQVKVRQGKGVELQLPDDVILRLEGLCMYFGGVKAVDDLSFDLKKGEIFGLIGPNGAGKTTVFNCITQFYRPTKGEILYKDGDNVQSLNDLSVHSVIPYGISRTFQNVETIWELTVLENVLIGAHTNFITGLFSHMFQTPALRREEKALRAKALTVLSYMGIAEYAGFYAYGLPYGVLKKIEIARALMCDPQFIILDEPAAGMNEVETKELSRLIQKIRDDYNCTVFLVEHDMGLVMDICERICAISFGKMLAIGTAKEIQQNPAVIEAYLGSEE